jgi:glycosyltransferase involved in cell wall biosynthesis
MKILVVQESDWIKRNPHQQHHLMERLSMRGHQVRVVDYPIDWKEDKGRYRKRSVVEGYYKIHPEARIQIISPSILKIAYLIYPSMLFYHRREIKRQIKEFNPDVIVGFGIINTYLASRTAKKEKIPFIYYWIDVLHMLIPEKSFQALGEYLERVTIKNSTEVIAINHKLEDFVKGLGAENTAIVGAGIDLEKFDISIDGKTIRKEYGIHEGDTLLFFMGFLYNFTGLKEVALELTKGEHPNLKLLIVGDGDAFQELQNIIEEHDLNDKVLLAGLKSYSEIPELVAASDICILPAYPDEEIMQDIVPIKIYEYMAMCKPVITTKLPGIMMEFGEGNGIYYVNRPEDVLSEVNNIDIKVAGEKARKFVEKNDWNKITDEFEDILENLKESMHTLY